MFALPEAESKITQTQSPYKRVRQIIRHPTPIHLVQLFTGNNTAKLHIIFMQSHAHNPNLAN